MMSELKPMPSYWALAEEVTHLHGQLDQLKAENAKLREVVLDGEESARLILDESRALESENAKLRELVRDMWRFTGTACKKYPRLFGPAAQGGQTVQLNPIDAFEQRMREIGVEADG